MKNIRAYLTTAVVSLMLAAVSAFSLSSADHTAAVCVPPLFGLVFSWSDVKAVLTAMDNDIRRKPAAVPCCACFQLKLA